MALFASNMPGEAGLRLLLSPLGSNIVVRTACCSVGVVLPVYSTFKALETRNQNEQQKWLLYWAAYGSFSIAEVFTDKILSWFPLYYYMKFSFLVWLQLPSSDGAKHLYMNHLRPLLLRHQARLDQIVAFSYGEMAKFVSAHQGEIQFIKTLVMKVWMSVNQLACGIFHPVKRQATGANRRSNTLRQTEGLIEGPTTQAQNSDSDKDE